MGEAVQRVRYELLAALQIHDKLTFQAHNTQQPTMGLPLCETSPFKQRSPTYSRSLYNLSYRLS